MAAATTPRGCVELASWVCRWVAGVVAIVGFSPAGLTMNDKCACVCVCVHVLRQLGLSTLYYRIGLMGVAQYTRAHMLTTCKETFTRHHTTNHS